MSACRARAQRATAELVDTIVRDYINSYLSRIIAVTKSNLSNDYKTTPLLARDASSFWLIAAVIVSGGVRG